MSAAERRFAPSLGTRIFLATSVLIAVSVGAAVAVSSLLIRGIARREVRDSLRMRSTVQETFQAQGYEKLKLISRLYVSDPKLTAYIAQAAGDRDVGSIIDLLQSRRGDLDFEFAIVLDPAGYVIARTDNPAASRQDLHRRPLVSQALSSLREVSGVWREGDRLYYAVVVPMTVNQFDLLGFLVTAFPITDRLAKEMNAVSGSYVTFVANDPAGPKVVASTLPTSLQQSLSAALRGPEMQRALRGGQEVADAELTLDGEPWLAQLTPLRDAPGHPVGATVALASLDKEFAGYRRIEWVLLLAGLAAVLLAPLLAFAMARRTLAPVRQLAAAAEGARLGNLDQKIDVEGSGEVGSLARAFAELLAELREKRDMEAYVTELSRNLPDPGPSQKLLGAPQSKEMVLMAVELRQFARTRGDAAPQTLARLGDEVRRIEGAVTAAGGQVEALAGHRVLARFEGRRRALGALAAAAAILREPPDRPEEEPTEPPVIALAAGVVVTGPVNWGEQSERALVGLPVQQLESLMREATPGELVLAREVHHQLEESFDEAGYKLAPRRGLVTPQPLYVLSGEMAARVSGEWTAAAGTGPAPGDGGGTLSGIGAGAIMGHRFQILSVLGSGGMGVVYKARDRELDDLVALKMLRQELWGDRSQLERLKSELKLARKITHPNVLRTFDFGEIDGVPYISMEYVRGVTLRYMLDQSHRLPYSAALRLAKQLSAGLGAAHAVGVIHRDIKPENLILEPTGNAKLMDFGIARPVTRVEPGQTQVGFLVGTPYYLAPEQLQGREADTRADIYACGVVLYEIFTGELPFSAAGTVEVMLKHLHEEPAPPSKFWPELPVRLEAVILRCLRKDPDERFRSVEELQRELEVLAA